MRIVFFSTAFPQPHEPSRNPDNLARCLALARDHHVHVISPLPWVHARATRERREPWVGPRLTVSRSIHGYPPGFLRGTHAWCMWQCIRASASRAMAQFRADAVLSYWTYPDSAVATAIADRAGVPCVAIVGGSDVLAIDPSSPGARGRRVVEVLQRVDAIAAVSESLKSHMTALGIHPRKIHVLSAAVDTSIFFPTSREEARRNLGIPLDAHMLVWVGRMVGVKALDVLLDAMAELTPAWPSLRLYLVGDGPLRRSLERKVAAHGLSTHVVFAGRVAHRALPPYYRAADVTVLPSHWEGMPNTLLESQACGTPFVASSVGAIPELAHEGIDELVVPGDTRQLAAAIAASLRRSSGRRTVTCRAGSWEDMAAQLADLLSDAVRTRQHLNRRHSVHASSLAGAPHTAARARATAGEDC
jgi:glycosyltransferase involved in cell wall biosynthesis